jgi:hypothetical protein
VERIEGLEEDHRDILAGFRTHYADRAPKALEAEQRRYFAKLERDERPDLADLLSANPIMVLKGPRPDRPTNVVHRRPRGLKPPVS